MNIEQIAEANTAIYERSANYLKVTGKINENKERHYDYPLSNNKLPYGECYTRAKEIYIQAEEYSALLSSDEVNNLSEEELSNISYEIENMIANLDDCKTI